MGKLVPCGRPWSIWVFWAGNVFGCKLDSGCLGRKFEGGKLLECSVPKWWPVVKPFWLGVGEMIVSGRFWWESTGKLFFWWNSKPWRRSTNVFCPGKITAWDLADGVVVVVVCLLGRKLRRDFCSKSLDLIFRHWPGKMIACEYLYLYLIDNISLKIIRATSIR